ncbi:SGNH/GDSL hydrolase family protein [Iningainema tapete]|uniref:SGNH/GDSL hydrolase family protein n=1 Tax=Iningainema tapete BLCC-T55 TaxID=2748662 RepID=A0A8J6XFA2_9CYAN|nr:SGNH/GDSL hydrolase family protein [Iningainema tapete]MBD2772808.1 SGNH/GDSL hydrolase family protein [Iningainema tapete BLCC-T55]
MRKQFIAAGFVFFSLISAQKATAADFSQLVVFGDSLSDTGNTFNISGGLINPTTAIPPNPPYFQGRFSNDLVWVDYVGEQLGLTPTLFTALTTTIPTQGINFAIGGANSGTGNAIVPNIPLPGVQEQVGLFAQPLLTSNQTADPNALFAVWGGGNDYLFGNVTDPNQTVQNLSNSVATLASVGAKNILVFNLPDLGKTPAALAAGNSSNLTTLTTIHNAALASALSQLSSSNPGVNIIPVDVYSLINRIIANPGEFGFNNVTASCVIGDLQNITSVCNNPNDFLFFDAVHPSTNAHRLVADTVFSATNATSVPEPTATLGILALGIGAAGVLKRKQKQSAIARSAAAKPNAPASRVQEV